MKKVLFQKIVNYLSGAAMCVGGGLLVAKGDTSAGIALILSGIGKITAHEMQSSEVKKVNLKLSDGNLNGKKNDL